jgi:hypothetical protein
LSLDQPDEGREFFRAALAGAQTDRERLSAAIVLSQFLLQQQQFSEYCDLATHTLAPLLISQWRDDWMLSQLSPQSPAAVATAPLSLIAGMSLLPLYAPEFVAKLPDEQLRATVLDWEALRHQANHDATKLGIDLFLKSAYAKLGEESQLKSVAERLPQNPARTKLLPEGGVAEVVQSIRALHELANGRRQPPPPK